MNTHTNKAPQNIGRAVAQEVAQTKSTEGAALQFADNRPEAVEQRAFQQSLNQSTATAQLTKLGEDERPSDGPDAEAAEIEWYRGNPYILDDKGAWRRVAREVVNNQRGERDSNHKITVAHLRTGVRKVYQKEATRIFKVDGASNFLQVVFKYGMAITAYYMSDGEAKREILGRRGTETQWSTYKEGMPVV